MLLNWLRNEKNQRLLAWIAAPLAAGWLLCACFYSLSALANPAVPVPAPTLPSNATAQPENTLHAEPDSARDSAEVDVKRTQSTPPSWLYDEKNQGLLATVVMALFAAAWALFVYLRPARQPPPVLSPEAQLTIQQTINNTITQIRENDPKLAEAVVLLTQQLGSKEAESRNLRDANSKLQQELEIARTALKLSQEARAPNAEPDVVAARAALLRGDTQAAEALLRKREQALAEQGRAHLAEAAGLARERGALATGRDTAAAVEAYRQATEYEPGNSANWWSLGDLLVAHGKLADAARAYTRYRDLSLDQLARDPANTQWQRDPSVSYNKIGDVLTAQGDRAAALTEFRKGLEIRERLAARDPANTEWQRDLVVSLHRVGGAVAAAEALPLLERAAAVLDRLSTAGRPLTDQRQLSGRSRN